MAGMIEKWERIKELHDLSRAGLPGPKGLPGIAGKKGWYKEKKEKEKNKNMKNMDIVNILLDAVVASGKKFGEIPKESIFTYLEKAGINRSKWQGIYDNLASNFKETVPIVKKVEQSHTHSKTELKQRQPRKSIFSEIKKITP
jgi:hypothetical protein